jgi:excisionase family DNA binding protein
LPSNLLYKSAGANQSMSEPIHNHSLSLLTAKQVAQILQWNHFTVIKKAEKGDLPGFKLGRGWRFRESDILLWIEKQRTNGKEKT